MGKESMVLGGTNLASVTTNAEELGMCKTHGIGIENEVRDGVIVDRVSLIPVVGDLFVARGVYKVWIVAGD